MSNPDASAERLAELTEADATDAELLERLAELTEADATDAELLEWLVAHPEFADDLAFARRVRTLLAELRTAEFEVPEGFELRLMARLNQDIFLRNLLDLGLNGVGRLLIEVIALVFGLPPKSPAPAGA